MKAPEGRAHDGAGANGSEAERTAGVSIEPGRAYGFFTDVTLCIGCKACEAACKQWNQLPADRPGLTFMSYDNTVALSATTWRHVTFLETEGQDSPFRWLMLSDVCKHCRDAGCLNACPTGAIVRTVYDSVYVQPDVCNGCGYCVPACPFGVVALDLGGSGRAGKCTLCYDRLQGGLEPACAKACPTDSITFGLVDELRQRAQERLQTVRGRGLASAQLYGADEEMAGGLNAFFLLSDRPELFGLPPAPRVPSHNVPGASVSTFFAGFALAAITLLGFAAGRGRPRGSER